MTSAVRWSRSILFGVCSLVAGVCAQEPARIFPADPADAPGYTLPDPLRTVGGRHIKSTDEWMRFGRPETLESFREHVFGRVPDTKYQQSFKVVNEDRRAMNGAATLRQVAITITANDRALTINLILFVPNRATKPSPAFLFICNRSVDNIDPTREKKSAFWSAEEGIARGYAMAAFHNGDVSPDQKDSHQHGAHALLNGDASRPDHWGTIAAWAWGASRCLDYLQTDPAIAQNQVAVIGHSRGGKTALWAGAEDPRFALVCSNNSGCGGAALSRRRVPGKESVAAINRAFPYWFATNFKKYDNNEAALPVDQHQLIALIAPRAVAIGSAAQDLWADPRGEYLSVIHAAPVYRLFGKEALGTSPDMPRIGEPRRGDRAHYHIRAGEHDLTLLDWTKYWDFADRVFGRPSGAAP